MKNISQYRDLLAERDRNDKTILKLTRRNKDIDKVIRDVSTLFGRTQRKRDNTVAETTKPKQVERVVVHQGITNKIRDLMTDGKTRTTEQIGKLLGLEVQNHNVIAKTCAYLAKQGVFLRIALGTYQMKRAKNNGRITTKLGHDTRITQMPAKQENV